jgi:hypothetical protein
MEWDLWDLEVCLMVALAAVERWWVIPKHGTVAHRRAAVERIERVRIRPPEKRGSLRWRLASVPLRLINLFVNGK